MVFAVGPAGTGKTHAAVGIALSHYRSKHSHKIVICRPAVEAGEELGYLPGTAEEKLRPYLLPIFESLSKLEGPQNQTVANGPDVEICAFAHMRGRTFQDAFIVVDEAQNATVAQLEMVMTRLGEGSKMIITGDPAQSDLRPQDSGLSIILGLIESLEGEIPIVTFSESDNLRHPVVALLTTLFARYHESKKATQKR
jgi:phosphate starvation-inducible PhoH-like protein